MRVCAYCGKNGKMTREELFPKSLVRRTLNYEANIDHSRPGKPLKAIQVVRDVCAECNNERLGALDAYGAALSDQYFGDFLDRPVSVDFTCDTDRLLRWLLKLSFNSTRISGNSTDIYRPLCPFILGDTADPGLALNLLIGLIEPYTTSLENSQSLYPAHQGFAEFADTDFGVGLPAKEYSALCRGVFLNSHLFCIIGWRPHVARPMRRRVLNLMKNRALTEVSRPNYSALLNGSCMTAAAVVWSTLHGDIIFDKP
jgi:hypothetical protein